MQQILSLASPGKTWFSWGRLLKGNAMQQAPHLLPWGERNNRSRRLKYVGEKESAAKLDSISIPTIPPVVIHFYRQRKDESLHALGIELWVGQRKKADTEPVQPKVWTEGQVKSYIKDAFKQFSQKYLVLFSGIAATVELQPNLCILLLCSLKISSFE